MKPAPVQNSSSLASLRSGFCSLIIILAIISNNTPLYAQTDSLIKALEKFYTYDSNGTKYVDSVKYKILMQPIYHHGPVYLQEPKEAIVKRRTRLVIAGNVIGYGGTMVGLYNAWYKNYPQSRFHTFNDWAEWKQVDKVGHLYSAYVESRGSMELWKWTGIDRKKRIWIGGMSGAFYQTVIETLDGFSEQWGWSWGDFGANILGSGMLVAQELAWNDQRIKLKFSFHKKNYRDQQLQQRTESLFGVGAAERFLKDYNGQTYWASANLKSFFPKSTLPPWLCVNIGYGAEGLFGGKENIAKDDNRNIIFDRPDIARRRQWYIGPDIDLSKIKTNSRPLKFFLTFLSAFKFPAPALELNPGGKTKFYFLYF
jgi:hypothetical protein